MARRKAKKYAGLFRRPDGMIWLSLSVGGERVRRSCKTRVWDDALRVRDSVKEKLAEEVLKH